MVEPEIASTSTVLSVPGLQSVALPVVRSIAARFERGTGPAVEPPGPAVRNSPPMPRVVPDTASDHTVPPTTVAKLVAVPVVVSKPAALSLAVAPFTCPNVPPA